MTGSFAENPMARDGNQLDPEDIEAGRLVARLKAGDRTAFGELYELYVGRVYTFLRLLLRDRHEAEDAAQEVFLKVFQAIPRYEQTERPFRAWLFTAVKNHALNVLEKHGRISPEEPDRISRRVERATAEWENGLAILDWITDRDLVLFIERLPLPQRQVLLLRYMLDLSDAQIAAVLDRNRGEVRMIQHRALAYLRQRLRAIGRGPEAERGVPMERVRRKGNVIRARRYALLRS